MSLFSSLSTGSKSGSKSDDLFQKIRTSDIEVSDGSIVTADDDGDKYIFELEPSSPTTSPTKKHTTFTPVLSRIEEGEEQYQEEDGQLGGEKGSKFLYFAVLMMHGSYPIDNIRQPVTFATPGMAPLISPGDKFDAYESLTICSAAAPAQINIGLGDMIGNVFHPLVMPHFFDFASSISDKISQIPVSVSIPGPDVSSIKKSESLSSSSADSIFEPSKSRSRVQSRGSSGRQGRGGAGKKSKLPSSSSRAPSYASSPSPAPSSSSMMSSISSRFKKLPGIVKSFSKGATRKLVSLFRGCVRLFINYSVDESVLNMTQRKYVILHKKLVNAIVCIRKNGNLDINDDLFNAVSYSLFQKLKKEDEKIFSGLCTSMMQTHKNSPGRTYEMAACALDNDYARYSSVRVLVKYGEYIPPHFDKVFSYHPISDATKVFGVRIYRVGINMVVSKKGMRETQTLLPIIDFFDIPILDVFPGLTPSPDSGYYNTQLSVLSKLFSSKIQANYGDSSGIKLSILDLSCCFFMETQRVIAEQITGEMTNPFLSFGKGSIHSVKLGGGGRCNKTRRRNMRKERKERKERNKSKIRNRRVDRRTRKNVRK